MIRSSLRFTPDVVRLGHLDDVRDRLARSSSRFDRRLSECIDDEGFHAMIALGPSYSSSTRSQLPSNPPDPLLETASSPSSASSASSSSASSSATEATTTMERRRRSSTRVESIEEDTMKRVDGESGLEDEDEDEDEEIHVLLALAKNGTIVRLIEGLDTTTRVDCYFRPLLGSILHAKPEIGPVKPTMGEQEGMLVVTALTGYRSYRENANECVVYGFHDGSIVMCSRLEDPYADCIRSRRLSVYESSSPVRWIVSLDSNEQEHRSHPSVLRETTLIVASVDGSICCFVYETGLARWRLSLDRSRISAFSLVDSSSLWIGCEDGVVTVVDPSTGRIQFEFLAHESGAVRDFFPSVVVSDSNATPTPVVWTCGGGVSGEIRVWNRELSSLQASSRIEKTEVANARPSLDSDPSAVGDALLEDANEIDPSNSKNSHMIPHLSPLCIVCGDDDRAAAARSLHVFPRQEDKLLLRDRRRKAWPHGAPITGLIRVPASLQSSSLPQEEKVISIDREGGLVVWNVQLLELSEMFAHAYPRGFEFRGLLHSPLRLYAFGSASCLFSSLTQDGMAAVVQTLESLQVQVGTLEDHLDQTSAQLRNIKMLSDAGKLCGSIEAISEETMSEKAHTGQEEENSTPSLDAASDPAFLSDGQFGSVDVENSVVFPDQSAWNSEDCSLDFVDCAQRLAQSLGRFPGESDADVLDKVLQSMDLEFLVMGVPFMMKLIRKSTRWVFDMVTAVKRYVLGPDYYSPIINVPTPRIAWKDILVQELPLPQEQSEYYSLEGFPPPVQFDYAYTQVKRSRQRSSRRVLLNRSAMASPSDSGSKTLFRSHLPREPIDANAHAFDSPGVLHDDRLIFDDVDSNYRVRAASMSSFVSEDDGSEYSGTRTNSYLEGKRSHVEVMVEDVVESDTISLQSSIEELRNLLWELKPVSLQHDFSDSDNHDVERSSVSSSLNDFECKSSLWCSSSRFIDQLLQGRAQFREITNRYFSKLYSSMKEVDEAMYHCRVEVSEFMKSIVQFAKELGYRVSNRMARDSVATLGVDSVFRSNQWSCLNLRTKLEAYGIESLLDFFSLHMQLQEFKLRYGILYAKLPSS